MKLMKKILVSAMAISAVAAFSTVAFADEVVTEDDGYEVVSASTDKFQVEYNETKGTIRLTGADALVSNDQMTLLILNDDVNAWDDTNAMAEAEGGAIVQIDQATALDAVEIPVGVRAAESTLVIRVGGDAAASSDAEAFHEVVYTFPKEQTSIYTNPERLVGDVDGNDTHTSNDAAQALKGSLDSTYLTGDAKHAADADDNGTLTSNDAAMILKKSLGTGDCAVEKLQDKQNPVG